MNKTGMFSNIHELQKGRIKPAVFQNCSKNWFMRFRSACCNDNTIKIIVFYCFANEIGSGRCSKGEISFRIVYIWKCFGKFNHFVHVYNACNINSAITWKNSNSYFIWVFRHNLSNPRLRTGVFWNC